MIKLFLDDERQPPDSSWIVCRDISAFVWYIDANGLPDLISFDHDLSDKQKVVTWGDRLVFTKDTGMQCAKWLIDFYQDMEADRPPFPKWRVHSMNPVGAENIRGLLASFEKHIKSEEKA